MLVKWKKSLYGKDLNVRRTINLKKSTTYGEHIQSGNPSTKCGECDMHTLGIILKGTFGFAIKN